MGGGFTGGRMLSGLFGISGAIRRKIEERFDPSRHTIEWGAEGDTGLLRVTGATANMGETEMAQGESGRIEHCVNEAGVMALVRNTIMGLQTTCGIWIGKNEDGEMILGLDNEWIRRIARDEIEAAIHDASDSPAKDEDEAPNQAQEWAADVENRLRALEKDRHEQLMGGIGTRMRSVPNCDLLDVDSSWVRKIAREEIHAERLEAWRGEARDMQAEQDAEPDYVGDMKQVAGLMAKAEDEVRDLQAEQDELPGTNNRLYDPARQRAAGLDVHHPASIAEKNEAMAALTDPRPAYDRGYEQGFKDGFKDGAAAETRRRCA